MIFEKKFKFEALSNKYFNYSAILFASIFVIVILNYFLNVSSWLFIIILSIFLLFLLSLSIKKYHEYRNEVIEINKTLDKWH